MKDPLYYFDFEYARTLNPVERKKYISDAAWLIAFDKTNDQLKKCVIGAVVVGVLLSLFSIIAGPPVAQVRTGCSASERYNCVKHGDAR